MEEKRKAPELRFPGFTDDWEQRKLSEVTQITMGQSPDGSTYSEKPSDYILIQGNADLKNGWVTPRIWTTQKTKTCDAGDLIMSVRAPAGEVGKTMYDAVIGRGVAAIKGNEFIYQSLVKMDIDGYWKRFAEGSTFESINSNTLFNAEMSIPSNQEQRKIGAFFSMLDKAIALHQRKENLLRELKKGMLQKIFSQEIRFKDDNGQDFPDWEENKLGSVCDTFYAGQTPTSSNAEYYHGNIPWVASGDLNRGIITRTEKNITEEGKNSARLKLLPKGSFLISLFGQEAPNVCGNCGILGIDATINQACMCIIPKKEKLLPTFLFQWYLYVGKSYGHRYPQGTKQQNYNVELIRDFNIFMPKNIVEQAKIADYLAHIDARITAEQKKVSSLQTMKKGFLQKMFV